MQPVDPAAGDLDAAKLEADLLQAPFCLFLGLVQDNAVALTVVPTPSPFDEAGCLLQIQHGDEFVIEESDRGVL